MWHIDPTQYRDLFDYLLNVDTRHLTATIRALPAHRRAHIAAACQRSTEEQKEHRRAVNRLNSQKSAAYFRALSPEEKRARIQPAIDAIKRMSPEQKRAKAAHMGNVRAARIREERLERMRLIFGDFLDGVQIPDAPGAREGMPPAMIMDRKRRALELYNTDDTLNMKQIAARVGLSERTVWRFLAEVSK